MMNSTGVVEGFFGPSWPLEARLSYATFLSQYGGDFFIYAPKEDPFLRKKWRYKWDSEFLSKIKKMIEVFHKSGVQFGVGFSPFGLGTSLTDEDKNHLKEKLTILNDLGIDLLGLFFDDMPTNENLAKTQIEGVKFIQGFYSKKIIFCPSYYTPDPILDKVFGQRPEKYLEEIAQGIPQNFSIAWTGPKVISPEIPEEHLLEVKSLLKRKPFIWENIYANDGPKNCKFLKLRPFSGRDNKAFAQTEAFAFNLMNQPELSKILYLSSKYVLEGMASPDEALLKAVNELCSTEFAAFFMNHKDEFMNLGLDKLEAPQKANYLEELASFEDFAAREIEDWLKGHYVVGSECLTD